MRHVDLVIAGATDAALAAALDAIRRDLRVLVVLRSSDARVGRRFRQRVRASAGGRTTRLTIASNADVVCVDGRENVEAVVIRHTRTGRVWAVNASMFVAFRG